jgi:O-antigen/teichoic acid export membrane protein
MLDHWWGEGTVGVYAVAVHFIDVGYMLAVIIVGAIFPSLIKSSEENDVNYKYSLQLWYDRLCWIGVLMGLLMSCVALIMLIPVFGQSYGDAVILVGILAMGMPFVYMRALWSKWIIISDIIWLSPVSHGAGMALNIALNAWWIPTNGALGAAWATVAAQVGAGYAILFFIACSRDAGWQQTLAMVAPIRRILRK